MNVLISWKNSWVSTHFWLKLDLRYFDEKTENEPKSCKLTVWIKLFVIKFPSPERKLLEFIKNFYSSSRIKLNKFLTVHIRANGLCWQAWNCIPAPNSINLLISRAYIDHTFYAKLFLHYSGLKAIKALLSSATFSPNGSVMHTEHWRFERGHCHSTMSWNPIWTRIIFDHAFIQWYNLHENINIECTSSRKIMWEHRSINKEFQLRMQSASWTMKAKCKRCRPREGWQYFSSYLYQSKIESNDCYNFELCSILFSCWLFSILHTLK